MSRAYTGPARLEPLVSDEARERGKKEDRAMRQRIRDMGGEA